MFAPKFSNTHTISSDCSHFWSEYYDKDRRKYYDAIQSVRENEMDMTTWLEYFTEGLSSQLAEMKTKGEKAIKRDVLIEKAKSKTDPTKYYVLL